MTFLCIVNQLNAYLIVALWAASVVAFWFFKSKVSNDVDSQSRYFLYYTLITGILLVVFKGKELGIPEEYFSHLIIELIGVLITVFLIDRVYDYMSSKNEELFRKLSLKICKMPIYTYCANWFFIFEPDNKKLNKELGKYNDLESFFKSDDFYRRICRFDFNEKIAPDKTYAQYYNESFLAIVDRFQNIISKYASRLSHKDLVLLEHFGGRAYIFTVFGVMKFVSEVKFSHKVGTERSTPLMPHNNSFTDVKRENFDKHFQKLIELINAYNSAVDNEYEKWTISNINKLHTIESANDNPAIEW